MSDELTTNNLLNALLDATHRQTAVMEEAASQQDLLETLLDATNRHNNTVLALVGFVRSEANMRADEEWARNVQAKAMAAWREQEPELVKRCTTARLRLNNLFTSYLDDLLSALDDIEDMDNSFSVRDFIDRFGAPLAQLNAMVQTLSHLGGP